MNLREALGIAIRSIRKSKNLSQEDFCVVSSRTYLSTLERGLKSPTLEKLDEISSAMQISPAALICVAYALKNTIDSAAAIEEITAEAKQLLSQIER